MDDVLPRDLCGPLIDDGDGNKGVDRNRKLKPLPLLREDADELDKPLFPDKPTNDFVDKLSPEISQGSRLVRQRLKYGVHSREIGITSFCTFIDVFCAFLAELLHPIFDGPAVTSDRLGTGYTV